MLNIRPLPPSLQKKAQIELNEVPERIEQDLAAIRAWIAKQPHLKVRDDDQHLITFLRGSKFSLERAKQKIDLFYSIRSLIPEMFENRNPFDPMCIKVMRLGITLPLPLTDGEDGPRLMIIRAGNYDPNEVTLPDIMKVSTMIGDILMLEDDNIVISGQVGILDSANVTMAHFLQYNPTFIKKMMMMSQEAAPLRQKGFHYLNTPAGFETVYNLFKSFMSEKNKRRLYVHGSNLEPFYKHVPKRLLPKEYGGETRSVDSIITEWEKKLQSYAEFFKDDEKYLVDERKRIGGIQSSESVFGIDGSFRKLNVD